MWLSSFWASVAVQSKDSRVGSEEWGAEGGFGKGAGRRKGGEMRPLPCARQASYTLGRGTSLGKEL